MSETTPVRPQRLASQLRAPGSRPQLSGTAPAAVSANTQQPRKSLPAINTHASTYAPSVEPAASSIEPRVALPSIITTAEVTLDTTPAPAKTSRRRETVKRRNRGPVITPRDFVALKYIGTCGIINADLLTDALSNFAYANVSTGEIKPASVGTVRTLLSKYRQLGLVDYKNNRNGTTIHFLTWDGYEAIGKEFPENRPLNFRNGPAPKPKKPREAPALTKWAHTLGLAALTIHYNKEKCYFITDEQMLKASEEMRFMDNKSNGYIPDRVIREDDSFKSMSEFQSCPEYFNFPKGSGGSHRPDLVINRKDSGVMAVELELHRKNKPEANSILTGYAMGIASGRFDYVIYWADKSVVPYMKRRLEEAVGPETHYRNFYDRFLLNTYDAAAWKATVPQL